jgi:hypothetical protein
MVTGVIVVLLFSPMFTPSLTVFPVSVSALGTVASVVSLELKVTIKSVLVSVLRLIVAVAVPVSEIISLSITTFKEGLSLSMILIFVVALPASEAIFVPV